MLSVLSGLVASVVFFLVLLIIRPKILISPKIAVAEEHGEIIYRVKVVNITKADLIDVKYSLHFCVPDGECLVGVVEKEPARPKLKTIHSYSRRSNNDEYAVRISYILDRLKLEINTKSYLEFRIEGKHMLSGTIGYAKKRYYIDDIEEGIFETGKSLRINQVKLRYSHFNYSSNYKTVVR